MSVNLPRSRLSDFPITRRWPPRDPTAVQLYSFPTPNGVKVSIAMEETGVPYDAHTVSIAKGDQRTEAFLSLAPNNKIPAIIDPKGPDGRPVAMFESGAILIYLAEKTGQLMPEGVQGRAEAIQWLMWQMGGLGPMFGQIGYFHKLKGAEIEDKRALQHYVAEGKRLLAVLEARLAGRDWIAGTYSIADIAIAPWLRGLRETYQAHDLVDLDGHTHVTAYLRRFLERPAVQRGLVQPPRD